jgi:hypothetical protein
MRASANVGDCPSFEGPMLLACNRVGNVALGSSARPRLAPRFRRKPTILPRRMSKFSRSRGWKQSDSPIFCSGLRWCPDRGREETSGGRALGHARAAGAAGAVVEIRSRLVADCRHAGTVGGGRAQLGCAKRNSPEPVAFTGAVYVSQAGDRGYSIARASGTRAVNRYVSSFFQDQHRGLRSGLAHV